MTAEIIANLFGSIIVVYLCCGAVFSIAFLSKGIRKVDETTHGSTWGFKLIIIPGVIALWPLLLQKWRNIKKASIARLEQ